VAGVHFSDLRPSSTRTTPVFWAALAVVVPVLIWGALSPGTLGSAVDAARVFVVDSLGWSYLLITTGLLLVAIYLAASRFGRIRLGADDERPEYSTGAWFAMLFSAGMGIGLVFWGVAEPVAHFAAPPVAEAGSNAAARDALRYTFFHWGLHPWAIYSVLALALAYARFRRGAPGTVSGALVPLLGERANGWIGRAVDTVAVVATVFGVATSLGLGAAQVNGGLATVVDGVPVSAVAQLVIIAVVTALFLLSALSGLQRGIKWLSSANVVIASLLLLLVMVAGPTSLLLGAFTTTLGGYLADLPSMSLQAAPFDDDRRAWVNAWTVFYWAWWISWSPFVATFIARISRGRTIREFVLGVLLVPTVVSALWFSVFGAAGIFAERNGEGLSELGTESQLFGLLATLPLTTLASIAAMAVIVTFFITSADSATYVLGSLSSGGADPVRPVTVAWGLVISASAGVLLLAGGLQAVQTASIIAAFPFGIVLVAATVSLLRSLAGDPAGRSRAGRTGEREPASLVR
jgi:glycine betaine transporter